jgi:myo-inositol 2-dehydrogenase/D-chiro-inositol 1-dehydrogenase
MRARLKIAILGAGRMGRLRAAAVAGHPRATLVAVLDADADVAERLASDHGARVVSAIDEAIAVADAVIVSTPSSSHAEYVVAAAGRGRAVFCEKPLALDVPTAVAATTAVEAAGVPSMIGFSKRFDPARRALEDAVKRGDIGRVEFVSLTNRDPNTTAYRPLLEYLRLMHDAAPFGIVRESTVHDFDTARALLGEEPTELHAVGASLASDEMAALGEPDTVSVTLRTAGGAICHIHGCWRTAYGYDQRIEAVGSTGMIRVENGPRPELVRYDEAGAHLGRMYEGPGRNFENWIYAFREAYVAELNHFLDSVLEGVEPLISVRDGLRAQVLVAAAVRSLQTGQPAPIEAA